jgi:hypothetical protein
MTKALKLTILICVMQFVFFVPVSQCLVFGQTNSADSSIQAANEAIRTAYTSIASAEKEGANVTALLNQLDVAAAYLSSAEIFYRVGDLASASSNAEKVLSIAQQVDSAAQTAELAAQVNSHDSFWSTFAVSVGGSAILALALLFVWRRIKSNHTEKFSQTKPELVSH